MPARPVAIVARADGDHGDVVPMDKPDGGSMIGGSITKLGGRNGNQHERSRETRTKDAARSNAVMQQDSDQTTCWGQATTNTVVR